MIVKGKYKRGIWTREISETASAIQDIVYFVDNILSENAIDL